MDLFSWLVHSEALYQFVSTGLKSEIRTIIDRSDSCAGLWACAHLWVILTPERAVRINCIRTPHCICIIHQVFKVDIVEPFSIIRALVICLRILWLTARRSCLWEATLSIVVSNFHICQVCELSIARVSRLARERLVEPFVIWVWDLSVNHTFPIRSNFFFLTWKSC